MVRATLTYMQDPKHVLYSAEYAALITGKTPADDATASEPENNGEEEGKKKLKGKKKDKKHVKSEDEEPKGSQDEESSNGTGVSE